jgi:hypothetical protein
VRSLISARNFVHAMCGTMTPGSEPGGGPWTAYSTSNRLQCVVGRSCDDSERDATAIGALTGREQPSVFAARHFGPKRPLDHAEANVGFSVLILKTLTMPSASSFIVVDELENCLCSRANRHSGLPARIGFVIHRTPDSMIWRPRWPRSVMSFLINSGFA